MHRLKRFSPIPAVHFLLLAALGCQGPTEPLTEPYDLVVIVESINEDRALVVIEVLSGQELDEQHGGVVDRSVSLPRVFRETPIRLLESSWSAIQVGDRLGLHASGATRSLPPHYFTEQIVILSDV